MLKYHQVGVIFMDGNTSNIGTVEPKPSTQKNIGTIFLAVVAIAGIICAAVFAFLYFKKPTILKNDNNNPSIISPSEDETDITDESVKNKLNTLVSGMFGQNTTSATIEVKNNSFSDVALFQRGTLSLDDSIVSTINSLPKSEFSSLTDEEKSSTEEILSNIGYIEVNSDDIVAVNGDTVADRYKELFGSYLDKTLITHGEYIYNPESNIFFSNPEANTEENANHRYYYVSKYTEIGDKAYVYLSGAQYDTTESLVYCTVFNPDYEYIANINVCEDGIKGDGFSLNDSNYKSYATSRLEFEKDEENNYYLLSAAPARL